MPGEFRDLIESKQIGPVVRGFETAIQHSFEQDHGPQTQAEVKRRFDICARIFRNLRGDLRWSVPKILDFLPRYLRCELDGQPWTPDDTRVWSPQG